MPNTALSRPNSSVTATQSIEARAPFRTYASLYNWNVYGPGYQDEEQKVEKDTSIYICQGSSEPPD